MADTTLLCANNTDCAEYNPATKLSAATWDAPICADCLRAAERDVPKLLWDYIDLEQELPTSMSQAMDTQPGGKAEPPIPLRASIEALQAEIAHTLTTWETELRAFCHLTDVRELRRHGAAVQRALLTIQPRLRELARIPATAVYPTGCEDEPADVCGWEAIAHLRHLHRLARAALGRTRRVLWVPGHCGQCKTQPVPGVDGPLFRQEPADPTPEMRRRTRERHHSDGPVELDDDPAVHCDKCQAVRSWADYDYYMQHLAWADEIGEPAEAAA